MMSLNNMVLLSSKFSAYFQMAVMMSRSVAQRLKSLSKIHCASTILEEIQSAGTYSRKKNHNYHSNHDFPWFSHGNFHFPIFSYFFHSMWDFRQPGLAACSHIILEMVRLWGSTCWTLGFGRTWYNECWLLYKPTFRTFTLKNGSLSLYLEWMINSHLNFDLWFIWSMMNSDEFWCGVQKWSQRSSPAGEAKVLSDMTFVDLPYENPQKQGRFGSFFSCPPWPRGHALSSSLLVRNWKFTFTSKLPWAMSNLRNWKNELGW